jgi:hypothetical protein
MRFVAPVTETIQLKDGHWIEIKKDLTAGEERALRSSGFRRVSQRKEDETNEVDVDWTAMAFARVEAYLVDWSARDDKGKSVAVSKAAIRALDEDSFNEIDEAIKAYVEARDAAKKAAAKPTTSGSSIASADSSAIPDGPGTSTSAPLNT